MNIYILKQKTCVIFSPQKGIKNESNKGKASAVDPNTGKNLGRILLDDPRWLTGEIQHSTKGKSNTVNKGKASARDAITKEPLGAILLNDIRWSTGEIESILKGRANKFKGITKEKY